MSDPWLTIIGLTEAGPDSLSSTSRAALQEAELVFGGPRHLQLAGVGAKGQAWPVPFSTAPVLAARGHRVVVLASGDPFWFGAGGSLVADLAQGEWTCHPAPSTFALAASALGWRLEDVLCLGLHAAPLPRLRPVLERGQKLICTLRDGAAVAELAAYLVSIGFGASQLAVLECLGGPRQKITHVRADQPLGQAFAAPVAVAILADGRGMARASGLADDLFDHDGQITKRPVLALTLSALAPHAGDVLWDIGTGSGSVSIEVLLAAPGSRAYAIEANASRAARARGNAARFGVDHRYTVIEAKGAEGWATFPDPDLVFVGGGASADLLAALWDRLPSGARLVMNAVTLETEALLYAAHATHGGHLMRIDLAESGPLGSKRGWEASRPVVQWSVTR